MKPDQLSVLAVPERFPVRIRVDGYLFFKVHVKLAKNLYTLYFCNRYKKVVCYTSRQTMDEFEEELPNFDEDTFDEDIEGLDLD